MVAGAASRALRSGASGNGEGASNDGFAATFGEVTGARFGKAGR